MTEHSGVSFAFFFLGEYTNMLVMSTLFSIYFLGIFFNIFLIFIMIWVRASLPRLRFDQLLYFGWQSILPLTLSFIILIPCIIFTFNF